jgi:S-adenosyl-L-methionine hydrolase (adenosine-forming)
MTTLNDVEIPKIVTFLSDFGWSGGYVAACEAVVARVSPRARVLHLSHEVPVGDVAGGALVLARIAPLYPRAVHLAVVDPGVGTRRRPLLLEAARGDLLVGPDNGLLLDAAEALGGLTAAWELDAARVRSRAALPAQQVSTTFHGRDLFAPAAALLTVGVEPVSVADTLDAAALVRLASSRALWDADAVSASVIEIDRFGNVGLGLTFAELPSAEGRFAVGVMGDGLPEWIARVVSTYADLDPGELGLIRDSWGKAALTLNGASAAEFLSVKLGTIVTLAPAEAHSQERS